MCPNDGKNHLHDGFNQITYMKPETTNILTLLVNLIQFSRQLAVYLCYRSTMSTV